MDYLCRELKVLKETVKRHLSRILFYTITNILLKCLCRNSFKICQCPPTMVVSMVANVQCTMCIIQFLVNTTRILICPFVCNRLKKKEGNENDSNRAKVSKTSCNSSILDGMRDRIHPLLQTSL